MNRITIKDFLNSKDNLAINAKTMQERQILCEALKKEGVDWSMNKTHEQCKDENLCYTNDNRIGTDIIMFVNKYKILTLDDVIL